MSMPGLGNQKWGLKQFFRGPNPHLSSYVGITLKHDIICRKFGLSCKLDTTTATCICSTDNEFVFEVYRLANIVPKAL